MFWRAYKFRPKSEDPSDLRQIHLRDLLDSAVCADAKGNNIFELEEAVKNESEFLCTVMFATLLFKAGFTEKARQYCLKAKEEVVQCDYPIQFGRELEMAKQLAELFEKLGDHKTARWVLSKIEPND